MQYRRREFPNKKSGRCCRPGGRVLVGIGCVLTALLLLLTCTPSWVAALLMAGLLMTLGCWLLGFYRR